MNGGVRPAVASAAGPLIPPTPWKIALKIHLNRGLRAFRRDDGLHLQQRLHRGNPLPSGEGQGEGSNISYKFLRLPPHPALQADLSQRERLCSTWRVS